MKSPIHAIVWETWRVTRVEAVWKLAIGVVGGLAVLGLCAALAPSDNPKLSADIKDNGAAIAMFLLVLPHLVSWLSPARLNGGQPGFPFCLHYTRPLRTAVVVGLPMAYLAAMSSVIYLVSALVLRVASGHAFPLLPVGAWVAAFTLIGVAATWSTRNRTIQLVVMLFAIMKILEMAMDRLTAVELPDGYDWPPRLWPTLFDFPVTDYVVIGAIALASFVVTVACVNGQRHGGRVAVASAQRNRLWDRFVGLFGIPCPTSSATRAQAWLDLKSHGLPMLTIGVALAIVTILMSAAAGPIDVAFAEEIRASLSCTNQDCFYARPMPVLFSALVVLTVLFLGGNAFGIHRRQGRAYINAFEATQAYGTARMAAIKLLVKSVCLLATLIAVGVSMWISTLLLGDAVFIQMWNTPLSSQIRAINGTIAAMAGYEQLSLLVVAAIGVFVWVAAFAILGALWTRYSRRVNICVSLLLLGGLLLVLMLLAGRHGMVSPSTVDAVFTALRWIAATALGLAIAYLFWTGFAEHLLSARYALGALVISVAFAVAWVTLRQAAGVQLSGMPWTNVASMLLVPLLLPLSATVLAPWAYSRVRHL